MEQNALMMSGGVEAAKQDISFRWIVRGPEVVSDGDGRKEDEEQHAQGKELRGRVLRPRVRVPPTHEGSDGDQNPRDIEDYFHVMGAPVEAGSTLRITAGKREVRLETATAGMARKPRG
jgi:hypothetical protein